MEIETILKEKISNLGSFLLSICNDKNKKKDIEKKLKKLPTYKILLFITLLDKNKIDYQINDFINIFSLNNTEENINKIKEYILYFIEIKEILNN